MRIALICNEYPPQSHGGIGTFVQTLARALDATGHDVAVIGLGGTKHFKMDGRIRVMILRASKLHLIGNLLSRLRLWFWLQSRMWQFDMIEIPDYLGLLPFPVVGCARVVRLHLSCTAIYRQAGRPVPKAIYLFERWTLRTNANWIGVSRHILDETQRLFALRPTQAAVIYNPVAPAPSDPQEMPALPEAFVLYAGQVSRRKGALILAIAARRFLVERPDVHLVYVGGEAGYVEAGSIRDDIRAAVGADLAKRVHFLGHLPRQHVVACMRRAQVLPFPSQLEALGLVVLEAMDCGLPVVCTRATTGQEMVEHGVNGLLADPEKPEEWSEQILTLLNDRPLAKRLAIAARATVAEKFALPRCVCETEAFYNKCLARVR